MLSRVGEGFADHVAGGDLNRFGQPSDGLHVELDRDDAAAGGGLQRWGDATFRQDAGLDAAGHLTQVIKHAGQPVGYAGQLVAR